MNVSAAGVLKKNNLHIHNKSPSGNDENNIGTAKKKVRIA